MKMNTLLNVTLCCASVTLASGCMHSHQPSLPQAHLQDGYGLPPTSAMDHLAGRIVNDLVRHHKGLNLNKVVLVATPVSVAQFSDSGDMAKQLQQSLMSSLQQQQFNLVDINLAQSMRITSQGDQILSRDWQQLRSDALVDYVLVTSYSFNREGMQVNSKILDLADQQVISASAAFASVAELPAYLAPSERSVSDNGILYRYSQPGEAKVRVLGDGR
ncbi:FlgO family outer membrane protein [Shewanella sp. NIFS-20-20]|uniref:FlgO family outer membrane protein n=1 Tax=Shewanella sp. NIFS-20-20 TaxID=2853806 RepID=UPI001C46F7C7|nr:FlgO family outer membrane protein [Shewanella sp. NIFS-20-20]MBV7314764.1 hypothetical protein [Shewanella sp. NIFS-20-20]